MSELSEEKTSGGLTYDGALGEPSGVGWELVAFAVAEIGHRSGCFTAGWRKRVSSALRSSTTNAPEGTVETAGKLGAVRHEVAAIAEAIVDESLLDGTNSACEGGGSARLRTQKDEGQLTIHHITGSHHMRSSLSISHCDLRHPLHTPPIINRPILAPQLPAMPMIRILAQTHITRHHQVRKLFTDELGGEDDGRLGVVGGGTAGVFGEVEGHTEEDDGFEAFCYERGEEGV